ncbi:hypothetical protein PENTCL1PPCAC_15801, partial [Pristionchus entomophagus]
RTPKALSSYSNFLLNIACVDLLASFSSFMAIVSVQNINGHIVLVYVGPCSLFNARVDLVGLSVLLLVLSFAYRLWVLKATIHQRKRQNIIWTLSRLTILVYGILNTLTMFLGASYTHPGFSEHTISVLDMTGGITENLNSRLSVGSLLVIYFFGFILLLIMHRQLFARVRNLVRSDKRHSHQMIRRSLTAQMMLPLISVFGASLWLLDVVGVVHSSTLQRLVIFVISIFALASPLINMHYIPPYRRLVSLFHS